MRHSLVLVVLLLAVSLVQHSASAYFNATYLTTTVFLTNSTSAHVVESVQLFVSNSSMATYNQDRQAFNLSLTSWQGAVMSPLLAQHILNPKGSISNFTFLPGPLVPGANGGYASLTMSYDAQNVTNFVSVAPRKYEYTFNDSAFNYLHTASGQSLLPSTRLTFVVPSGTEVLSVYPAPDYPQPNSVGQYNSTSFAWYSGEPLSKFAFVYIMTETPQQEVINYFNGIYNNYRILVYLVILIALAGMGYYTYTRIFGR